MLWRNGSAHSRSNIDHILLGVLDNDPSTLSLSRWRWTIHHVTGLLHHFISKYAGFARYTGNNVIFSNSTSRQPLPVFVPQDGVLGAAGVGKRDSAMTNGDLLRVATEGGNRQIACWRIGARWMSTSPLNCRRPIETGSAGVNG